MAYFQEAISFQSSSQSTPTDRIHSIRSSLHFIHLVVERIRDAFVLRSATERTPVYELYLANMLAEVTELAHHVASNGAEMAVGYSDASRASSGSYVDLTEAMWGSYNLPDQFWFEQYFDLREGRRASAQAMLQGWPWRAVSEVTGNNGDPAILPACATNFDESNVQKALDLLGKHGVPVRWYPGGLIMISIWKSGTSEFGAAFLTDQVNQERAGFGLPALTYEQLLEEYETTDEALWKASVQLYRELSIYLKQVVVQPYEPYEPYVVALKGMINNIEDYQQLLVRARTGAYNYETISSEDTGTPSASAGLVTILSNVLDLSSCLLEGDGSQGGVCIGLDANDRVADSDAQEIVTKARSSISGFVGARSVRYDRLVVPGSAWNFAGVSLEGFDVDDTGDVAVYSTYSTDAQGRVIPPFYKLLSCLRLSAFDDLDCEAFKSSALVCSVGTTPCWVPLPPTEDKKMIIVAKGDRVIDMYAERRPFDVPTTGGWIFTRHFIDQSIVSEYGKVITRRNSRDCSKPYANSLGLPFDMPIPLENELTSDSDTYEDAYAFYITRAKEAGNEATSAIDRANSDLINQQSATLRVENQKQDALDRIEQICGVGQTSCSTGRVDRRLDQLHLLPYVPGSGDDCGIAPRVDPFAPAMFTEESFDDIVEYVNCMGRKFVGQVGEIEISGLPETVELAAVAGELTTMSFSEFSGEYKTALLEMSSALVDLRSAVASANNVIQELPTLVSAEKWNIMAMQTETAALLVDAISRAAECTPAGGIGAAAAGLRAAANVMKTIAQTYSFLLTIQDQISKIEQNMLSVEKAVLAMKMSIEKLNNLELEQRQVMDRADRLGQAEIAQYVGTSPTNPLKAFRQHTLVSHLQARRAVRRAKKMAFIARKAVEQRLAVDLTQEKEMPVIGEPPAKWVDDLFTMYQSDDIWEENSAAYTYVQRLEDCVYNYPFQYPFADGLDTAVLSLRDDLSSFNQNCLVPGNLKNIVDFSEEVDRWDLLLGDGSIIVDVEDDPFGGQTAERVRFQCSIFGCPDLNSPEYVDDYGQSAAYAGSVYLRRAESPFTDASIQMVARYRCTDDWKTVNSTVQGQAVHANLDRNWKRVSTTLARLKMPDNSNCATTDGEERVTLQMVIHLQESSSGRGEIHVSGAQIEQGEEATEYEMSPTYGTHPDCITVTVQDPWSTDPNATMELTYYDPTLRTQRLLDSFSAKCVDDEFAIPGQAPSECWGKGGVDYLERQFSITLAGIESGQIIQQGQIGGGNYNYRINDMAINLVGSNVKDCSLDPGAGTTCYANQFIPYDLIQDGAVKIRNHAGVELPFKLSVGRIHQAKALAAERLMTNPLSSTDSALIQQYRKNEFRGRPIQGVYTLRLHAVPSLRWTNVEDVQFVLGYRYWSAFSNP